MVQAPATKPPGPPVAGNRPHHRADAGPSAAAGSNKGKTLQTVTREDSRGNSKQTSGISRGMEARVGNGPGSRCRGAHLQGHIS